MELKKTEKEVEDLRRLYESVRLRSQQLGKAEFPSLGIQLDEIDDIEKPTEGFASATDTLKDVESIQIKLHDLLNRIQKFEKRRTEKDPVTGNPRFGQKTLIRVEIVISRYYDLQKTLLHASGQSSEADTHMAVEAPISMLQERADEEKAADEMKRHEREEAAKRAEEARQAEAQEKEEALRQKAEEERQEAEQQRIEAARRIEEARLARVRAQQEAERADRAFVASVTKGVEGVKKYLKVLAESTKDDRPGWTAAINALHVIFAQIVSRPEENNFRRIRRDHPAFLRDVGRHDGGKELLVAAGFTLGAIDDVPAFICKEPNIEKDMDGWSSWFDTLKATVEAIEEEMIK